MFVAAAVPHRFHDIDGATGDPGGIRAGRGRPRLTGLAGGAARDGGCELERQLRATPDRVVAEEDVGVVAGVEEWLEAGGPGSELVGVVVVAPEPQVQERPGPPDGRRLRVVGQLGRAQRGARRGERLERLVDVPARVLELERQRQVARPRRQQRGQPVVVALDARRDAEQDGPEPLPERPVRPGQPRELAPGSPPSPGTTRRAGP